MKVNEKNIINEMTDVKEREKSLESYDCKVNQRQKGHRLKYSKTFAAFIPKLKNSYIRTAS